MAQKITLVDDINGAEDAETTRFAYADTAYEIDLTVDNIEKLEKALAPFVAHARKVGHKAKKAIGITKPSSSADLGAIRAWARKRGQKVSDRGRIPRDIVDAFNAEHTVESPMFSGV